MATTGFWPIKGRLKEAIDYAENPDKTTDRKYLDGDLYSALRYAANDEKTDKKMYVSAINCPKQLAYETMMDTKRRYGKLGGNVAYHGYQSFKTGEVTDNEEMDQLVWSVLTQGLLTPLVVRPLPNGEYEVVSGHRRLHACKKAGIETVPALITDMNRDAATIALLDSNLHREKILPSEKAFAYKMKMEAMKHQGTSRQLGEKWSVTQLSEAGEDSERQIHRYIRLTHLLPELLQKVDEGQLAFTPAVHLSYLSSAEQGWVLDEMEYNDCTPSVGQAYHLKEYSTAGTLTRDFVAGLMSQEKANQKERLKIPMERIRKYFPRHYTTAQMEDDIIKMCEARYRKRTDRDAR